MTLNSASPSPGPDAERRATLARVYAYLIEQGRLRKKQNIQPTASLKLADLPTSPQQDDQACPNA
jgi:hypothetical protein